MTAVLNSSPSARCLALPLKRMEEDHEEVVQAVVVELVQIVDLILLVLDVDIADAALRNS